MSALKPSLLGAMALAIAVLVATQCGKAFVPLDIQWRMLLYHGFGKGTVNWPDAFESVIWSIRAPRIVGAALAGCALASAGASYQGLFRNPLADPYLMGVASGAGLGAVLGFVLMLPSTILGIGTVQMLAFVGAMGTVLVVYAIAKSGGSTSSTTLILAGVAVGAIANSLMAYLMFTNGDRLQAVYGWLLGGFNSTEWHQVGLIAPAIGLSAVALLLSARVLNLLQLDEDQAMSLGVRVDRARVLIVCAATLATAAAVSISGLIGFVGLIVPHATRLMFGSDYRRLLPAAMLFGAAFLVATDTVARSLPGPEELPVGVVTAALGAPFFLVLLRTRTWRRR